LRYNKKSISDPDGNSNKPAEPVSIALAKANICVLPSGFWVTLHAGHFITDVTQKSK